MTILPIKKYFPSFYSKIEQFFIKTKSMININQICLKQNSDIKLYEKYQRPIYEREIVGLPSTSPANAAFRLERLMEAWQVILNSTIL